MKKHIKKVRSHINESTHEMVVLSIVAITFSILYLIFSTRDNYIATIMRATNSDTLAKVIYFDKRNDPGFFCALGDYYFGQGDYNIDKAKKYYLKCLDLDPKYSLGNYQLSRVYFITGDQLSALYYINKQIEVSPEFGRSYYIRGLVNGYSNKLEDSVKDFKKFLEWMPDSWAGHNDLAWVYFQLGDFENSYETAVDGLKFAPGNPWLLNTVGISLKNMGDTEGARNAFLAAQKQADLLTEESWGKAYPGNDPSFYATGLDNMKKTIEKNLKLTQ